jgi:hypothetical protein
VLPDHQYILKIGTELVPETSENFHIMTRLSAGENFIEFCDRESFKTVHLTTHRFRYARNIAVESTDFYVRDTFTDTCRFEWEIRAVRLACEARKVYARFFLAQERGKACP